MNRRTSSPLANHWDQKPPPILYHYTSLEVLEKITRSGEIWASDIEFLNDSEEHVNAKRFIKQELERLVVLNEKLRSVVQAHLTQIEHELDHLDTYITSFSTEADSLSQWRGYCPNAQGVAIGFLSASIQSAELGAITEDYQRVDLKLLKCVYTPKEKSKLLGAYLDHFLRLVDHHLGTDSILPGSFLQALTEACCPFFKNENFNEEREWRLSLGCLSRTVPSREFHIGRSTIIPHLRVNLKKNYTINFIKEVVIGPTPNQSLAYMGVKTLLNRRELSRVEVRNSSIPYRTW